MPTKNPTPKQREAWEAGRRRRRASLTLAPETMRTLELIAEAEGVSLSRAVDLLALEHDRQNEKTPA